MASHYERIRRRNPNMTGESIRILAGLAEDNDRAKREKTAPATVPPEVMAKLVAYKNALLAGETAAAELAELRQAIAAAIEAARRRDTDSMSYRAKPEPFIG